MHRRSGFRIMCKMIGLVKPLAHIMAGAVFLGVVGYLCAIFLTILAGFAVLEILGMDILMSQKGIFVLLITIGILRGILHYGEQACNHFIAFKILAVIRHKVFASLRRLAPAKLEGREKGNLISIITSDIELLEVFYAHTISPVAIGFLTSIIMCFFIGYQYLPAAFLALAAFGVVGIVIPLWNSRQGQAHGMEYRNLFGEMNSSVLDNLRGLSETIQYRYGATQLSKMQHQSAQLAQKQEKLQAMEGSTRALTDAAILLFSFGMLFMTMLAYQNGRINFTAVVICTISMIGSFGPTIALSNLSNNLSQTLASGERVLSLLEETPVVEEVSDMPPTEFTHGNFEHVSFAYEDEVILDDFHFSLPHGKMIGIHGKSGSGKSTMLKLLMRFWDAGSGAVNISGRNVKNINTRDLRDMQSYVTQETYLFHDTIRANIGVAKLGASLEEIKTAAKKASIHDFIQGLPKGYDTSVGELGDTLSGGERQRIGLARAFLHQAPLILLDEPTSNLDSLNERIILKSLREACSGQTIILVSHRQSTLNIVDEVYQMRETRVS